MSVIAIINEKLKETIFSDTESYICAAGSSVFTQNTQSEWKTYALRHK